MFTPNEVAAMGNVNATQDSISRSVLYHLVPGIPVLGLYLWIAPMLMRHGYPAVLGATVAGVLGIVPIQVGEMLYAGKQRNGRWSFTGVLPTLAPMPIWQYVGFVLVLIALSVGLAMAAGPVDGWLAQRAFAWLPAWLRFGDPSEYTHYSRSALNFTFGAYLVAGCVLIPVVEELYFRGYLMSRISRFGAWTPVLNAGLFTMYHFWQPFNYVTIFVTVLPMVWVVWRRRNVMIGVLTHVALNALGGISLWAAMVR